MVWFQSSRFAPILILLLLAAPAAGVGPLAVSTGPKFGSYFFIGDQLRTEMLLAHSIPVGVLESQGSLENLERLDDPEHPANLALSQADALRHYLDAHPEFAGEFVVLGDVGRECVFIVSAREGPVSSAADLKRSGAGEISVHSVGSGAAVTFEALSQRAPGFRHATPVFVSTSEALLQLASRNAYTKLEAAMLVQRPSRLSPPLRRVIQKPDVYRLVAIRPEDVPNAVLPDGSDVYSFERVRLGGRGGPGPEIDTLCTPALLLGAKAKLSDPQRDQISQLMLRAGSTISGEDD